MSKFLNSGCFAGRVGQVRQMVKDTLQSSLALNNDQWSIIRYAAMHPELISLDFDDQMFMTTDQTDEVIHAPNIDLSYYPSSRKGIGARSVGLIHCNGKHFNTFYDDYATSLHALYRDHYSGPDGEYLLRAVHYIRDKDHSAAKEALNRREVLVNMTSRGGRNMLGDYLLNMLGVEQL